MFDSKRESRRMIVRKAEKSRSNRTLRVCNVCSVHRAHTIHMICYCKWIRSKLSLADKHTQLARSLAREQEYPSSYLMKLLYIVLVESKYIYFALVNAHSLCCWWRASACMLKHVHILSLTQRRANAYLHTNTYLLTHTHTPNSNDYRISHPFHRILFLLRYKSSIRSFVRSFVRIKYTATYYTIAYHIFCYVRSHLTWCSLLNLFTAHLLLMLMLLLPPLVSTVCCCCFSC